MKSPHLALALASLLVVPICLAQAPSAPAAKSGNTEWPSYNGDYSGRRFSPLTQITPANAGDLGVAWIWRSDFDGPESGGSVLEPTYLKATPLEVGGILYLSEPDNVWAVDARSGHQIWHYKYHANTGFHIASRGVAKDGDWLYFETPDDYLVSLDARTGKERWSVEMADVKLDYYSTMAPLIIGNHVIVSVGGDTLDNACFIEARDPKTGAPQWRWYTEAQPGEPEFKTWPNAFAAKHGGGSPWMIPTYDPELNLMYLGVGNPSPVVNGLGREGANLWTDSIVALNPDTGKLAWYFQTTIHDTHDWDATETPVLLDADIDGTPRKLLAQANRNGFFFVLDRATGKALVTAPFVYTNWSTGINAIGQPIPNPQKEPSMAGTLACPGSASNWPSPSYDPQTKLFYVLASQSCGLWFRHSNKPAVGWSDNILPGALRPAVASPWRTVAFHFPSPATRLSPAPIATPGVYRNTVETATGGSLPGTVSDADIPFGTWIRAIDYQTGKLVWSHPSGGARSGIMTTAGGVLFASDGQANALLALDPKTGATLWHMIVNEQTYSSPMSYELDGRQYVLMGVGNSLWALTLPDKDVRASAALGESTARR
ncbi:MAG: PQQ-binding-like beta-propeller repeat protein [Terriglobales bacterium]